MTYECRVCFENFERNEVISPCKCNGSQKYICKICLNTYITSSNNNVDCPSCKTKYKRDVPDNSAKINHEIKNEVFFGIGFLTLSVCLILLLSQNKDCLGLCLLLIFLLTNFLLIKTGKHNYLFYVSFIYISFLYLEQKYAYYFFSIWLLFLYSFYSYNLLGNKWNILFNIKYNNMIKDLKCSMFDFDLNSYVTGIL